jgi:hypothetical protein
MAAEPCVTGRMAELLLYEPDTHLVESASWLLATSYLVPGFFTDVFADGGPRDERGGVHDLHREVARSFITAWNLLKPCNVRAPYIFQATVDPDPLRILEVNEAEDYAFLRLDASHACRTEALTLSDVEPFLEAWQGIATLREFPAALSGFSASAMEFLFDAQHIERRRTATRLGRALQLFEEGMWLSRLHAFLSFWLTVETLYSTGRRSEKLSDRVGYFLGGKAGFVRCSSHAERVYSVRNKVVHGEASEIRPAIVDTSYRLCAGSLRRILSDRALLEVFTSSTGEDVRFLMGLDREVPGA